MSRETEVLRELGDALDKERAIHAARNFPHKTLLAAKQTLIDAAVSFAVIAETEPCVSFRYDAAMERLHTAAKDYTEASLRCGLTNQERIG